MAIGRNILGALGGLLNRRPDEEDPLAGLSPEALAGYYATQAQNQERNTVTPLSPAPLAGGGQMSAEGGIDAALRSAERARGLQQDANFDAMNRRTEDRNRVEDARRVREAREDAERRNAKRRFDNERRDMASDKSRQEQEARMARQNLRDAESGARSDFQDRESQDRILEGILKGRAEDQVQEQADQDLIATNEQNFLQKQQERFSGKEPERYSRMLEKQRLDKNIEDIRARDLLRKRTERSDRLKAEGLSRKPQIGSFDLDANRQLNQQFPPTPEEAITEELKKTSSTASVEPPVEPPVEPATNEDFSFLENPENVFQDTSDMKVEEEYDLQQAPVRVREGAVSPATGSKLRGTMSEYETEDELEQRLREERDLERKQDALDFYNKSKGSRLFGLPSSYHENLQKEVDAKTETPTERTPVLFGQGPEVKITSSEELGDSFDEDLDETETTGTANFRGNKDVPFGDISGRPNPSVLSAQNYYDSLGPSNDPGELGSYRTLGDDPRTVTDVTTPDMETPVAEEEKEQSFFGKIGQLIKNNPEVAAQIAQLGGGLISSAAQGKAQRKADAETQRRLARANLTGAFTGRTPAVQAATADTGGFFSLDTLGKAIGGGGAIAQDEIARGKAEKELQRKADLEQQESARKDFESESRNSWEIERNRIAALDQESQAQDRITRGQNASRELDINEQKYKNDNEYNIEKNNLTKLGYGLDYLKDLQAGQQKDMLPEKLQDQYIKKIGIADMLDDVEELTNAAGFGQAGTSLTMLTWTGLEQLPQFMGGKSTTLLKQAVNRLVQTLGQEMSGVLSNQDIQFIKQYTPSAEDRADVALEKIRKLRNELAKSSRTAFDVHSAYFHTGGVEPQMRRLMRLNEDSDAKSEEQLNTAIDQYAKTGGS